MDEVEFLVPEFEYRPKGIFWNIIFGILAVELGIIAWSFENYTFMALLAVIWAVVVIRQIKKPELISFHIDDGKISLGSKTWDFREIKNFSIFDAEGKRYFIFIPLGRFRVAMKIPVSNPAPIMEKLNNYVPQVEYEESLLEIAARKLNI